MPANADSTYYVNDAFAHTKSDLDPGMVFGRYTNKAFVDNEDILKPKSLDSKGENEKDNKADEKNEKDDVIPSVGFLELFSFSSTRDRVLLFVATIVALASGALLPGLVVNLGTVIDKFIMFGMAVNIENNPYAPNMTTAEFLEETRLLCLRHTFYGIGFVVCNYIVVSFFSLAAADQAFRIRCRFMASVLRQDIGWYDTNETKDITCRITGDLNRIQDGIGEKAGICVNYLSSIVLCVACAFYYGWRLALVVLAVTPVLTIATGIMLKIQASVSRQEADAYGKAGAVAEEVFSSIRTVFAFGGEKKEIQRYDKCLRPARKMGIKRGLMTGIGQGLTWLCVFSGYALTFWYGMKLIVDDMGKENPQYTGGKLLIIFFNVMIASMYLGQIVPYFEAFALAKGAAEKVFATIRRIPSIDSSSKEGKQPKSLVGNISLNSVCFSYPSRYSVPILKHISLDVKPGETVALVGPSGCGKSTVIQLILRFYDTDSGTVMVDGHDVKDLNVGWLRDHIGLVGQEPVLFSTTIAENIRFGRQSATPEEIENAAKLANVHDFIQALPMGYATPVGERGAQLSGGQKQRVAIARALLKNPRILLLDEATSALDTESEALVQAALDKARCGRTTIVVAHRLSTIRSADKIVVLSEGEVKEVGTHDQLMELKGVYHQLALHQKKVLDSAQDYQRMENSWTLEPNAPYKKSSTNTATPRSMEPIQLVAELVVKLVTKADDHSDTVQLIQKRTPEKSLEKSKITLRRFSSVAPEDADERRLTLHSPSRQMRTEEREMENQEEPLGHGESPSQFRLWKTTVSEWPYTFVGAISAILFGLHFPAYGIVLGGIMGILSLGDKDEINEQTIHYCLLFVGMAITAGITSFLQIYMFTITGEQMTYKLRKMVFSNLIRQDVEFYDNSKNSIGSLCYRLTSDASSVQGATGARVSTLLQASATLIGSVCLALGYNWKLGLVVLAFVPVVLIGRYFQDQVVAAESKRDTKGTEKASQVAVESIENIRTVASLHQEDTFYHEFRSALLEPYRKSRLKSHVQGIIYGLAQSLQVFAYASSLYYGSRLIAERELSYEILMKILEGVMIGVMMIGQAIAFAPDYQKAKTAAVRIFKLLDLKPKINAFSDDGKMMSNVKGQLRFEKLHFNYPSRPDVNILKGLNFKIEPGQTVALVGSSGCGKSTCVQLLERFYDTHQGSVCVDDTDVRDMNVSNLRSHLGIVSQEPTLFGCSIAENIAYGDNGRDVPMSDIVEAARQANIHGFIASLPLGYDTPVGDKGAQLSGGQKQRVAIARALLRNPKILLLDEATSALDTESEKVVQEALDRARTGRTCLVIAHRLTTVQNADVIVVIHDGKVVEKGTHQDLMILKGHYYKLHSSQRVS